MRWLKLLVWCLPFGPLFWIMGEIAEEQAAESRRYSEERHRGDR
jgi:hypothetical protein